MKLAFLNYEPCGKEGELYYQLKRGWSCSTKKKSKHLRVEYHNLVSRQWDSSLVNYLNRVTTSVPTIFQTHLFPMIFERWWMLYSMAKNEHIFKLLLNSLHCLMHNKRVASAYR